MQQKSSEITETYYTNLTFICPCTASISLNYNQQDATFSRSISINCFTCFRRFHRPSSGAQNCTASGIVKPILLPAAIMDEMESCEFHLIHNSSSIGLTIPEAVRTVLCSWWWAEEPPETWRAIYKNK